MTRVVCTMVAAMLTWSCLFSMQWASDAVAMDFAMPGLKVEVFGNTVVDKQRERKERR